MIPICFCKVSGIYRFLTGLAGRRKTGHNPKLLLQIQPIGPVIFILLSMVHRSFLNDFCEAGCFVRDTSYDVDSCGRSDTLSRFGERSTYGLAPVVPEPI